jgi:hypothetical protein
MSKSPTHPLSIHISLFLSLVLSHAWLLHNLKGTGFQRFVIHRPVKQHGVFSTLHYACKSIRK